MDNLTNMTDFITSALPCIAGVIIGEVIVKVWEKHHDRTQQCDGRLHIIKLSDDIQIQFILWN